MLYYMMDLFYFYSLLLFSCVMGNIMGFYQRVSFFELAQLHVLPKVQEASTFSIKYATNLYNTYCKSYVDNTILPFFNISRPPMNPTNPKNNNIKEKIDRFEKTRVGITSPRNMPMSPMSPK